MDLLTIKKYFCRCPILFRSLSVYIWHHILYSIISVARSCYVASLLCESEPASCQSSCCACAILLCLPTFPARSQMREEYLQSLKPSHHLSHIPTTLCLPPLHSWLLPSKDSQRHSREWDKSDFSRQNTAVLAWVPAGVTGGATRRLRFWMHRFDLPLHH